MLNLRVVLICCDLAIVFLLGLLVVRPIGIIIEKKTPPPPAILDLVRQDGTHLTIALKDIVGVGEAPETGATWVAVVADGNGSRLHVLQPSRVDISAAWAKYLEYYEPCPRELTTQGG